MDKTLGPLPFVIGVTGHRDLRDEDILPLKKAVAKIFGEFVRRMPSTPLVVLSALAEGADRLVAEVALANNVRLIVPLPMGQSEYEKDFDASSLTEFRNLLARADERFELPTVEGNVEKDSAGDKRSLQYAQLGQYVVLHSHLVLALWDGLDPELLGGTADVVKMCLKEGRMEELPSGSAWLNYEDECGPVYQVLTPRRKTDPSVPLDMKQFVAGPGMVPAKAKLIYPEGTEDRVLASWKSTERFNRDCITKHKAIEEARAASRKTLEETDPSELKRLPNLENVFVAADVLAEHMKRAWEKTVLTVQILAVLSLFAFSAAKYLDKLMYHGMHWATWVWGAFLVCSAITYSVWIFAHKRRIHNRFLDYRGLAEALRVQFNWNVAGIYDIEVADCYLRYQIETFTWLRTATRVCCIGQTFTVEDAGRASAPSEPDDRNSNRTKLPTSQSKDADRVSRVFKNWVKEQSEYYDQATPKRDAISSRLSLWAMVWVLFAMACTVLLWQNAMETLRLGLPIGVIKMFADVLFGMAAVVAGYAGILAVEDESRQFRRMRTIYARANRLRERFHLDQIETTEGMTNARKIIRELGKEALEENSDWIVMHRAHPLNLPRWGTVIGIIKKSIIRKKKG